MGEEPRVLVVDDEIRFAQNLVRLLNAREFCAQAVSSGEKALEAAAQRRFDAVVLDVKMPGMDGIETLRELKKQDSGLEVIMLTGNADMESGIQAIREGAFDYLFKPCGIDILAEKINEAVAAEKIKQHPVLWPRRVVKEISNADFIRLDTGDNLKKALDIFNAIGQAPKREELHVTDRQDRLRGVVSKNDLIRAAQDRNPDARIDWPDLAQNPQWLPAKQVADIMRPPPAVHAAPEDRLTRVAELMIDNNVRCLPVIEESRFIGIIRFSDLLHYVSLESDSGAVNEDPQ